MITVGVNMIYSDKNERKKSIEPRKKDLKYEKCFTSKKLLS